MLSHELHGFTATVGPSWYNISTRPRMAIPTVTIRNRWGQTSLASNKHSEVADDGASDASRLRSCSRLRCKDGP